MKKSGPEARSRKKRPIKAVCYLRVGSATQLSLEEQRKYFKVKSERVQKGEE